VLVKIKDIFVNSNGLMRYFLLMTFLFTGTAVSAQTALTIEGKSYTNSDETWVGVNIQRTTPTILSFRNNSITSKNLYGYMLQAGDEVEAANNNNLDGASITGNKFTWTGTNMESITHGLFTGHNINLNIEYNYLDHVPMGIIRKSTNNMVNTSGGVAYNIVISPNTGIVVKGMSGVCIYNNTLYQDRTTSQTSRGLIDIYTNQDVSPFSVSHNTKIYNNIFYTKYGTACINVMDQESLTGLQSDYNIYYCETGTPRFKVAGAVKTFAEWQAMGYDTHSRVINPNFKDLVSFVPAVRLDYGTNLGSTWAQGLSVNARWGTTNPATAQQNGTWQVGAMIYAQVVENENQPPTVSISSPTKSTGYTAPATIVIDATASDPDGSISKVEFYSGTAKLGERTAAPWSYSWKDVPEGTYSITAAATDNLNSRTVSAPVSVAVEKAAVAANQLPSVSISSPGNNTSFEAPATVTLTVKAYDTDGSVDRVEYFVGQDKIGESLLPPFSFSFQCDTAGTYEITAIAYDNLSASANSTPITISISLKREYPDLVNLYPNPNKGVFTVDLYGLPEFADPATMTIVNLSGRTIYTDVITTGEMTKQIDISESLSGNYILLITNGGKVLTTRQFIRY
jgi:hypothetical protein